MPIAAVAPTDATVAEKFARPPPSNIWSAANADNLAGRPIDPDLRVHLECVALDARLKLLIAVVASRTGRPGKNIAASAT